MRKLTHWFPGLGIVIDYRAAWLPHDLAAGFVLVTMLVPTGIAYAVASGVTATHGLYATIAAMLAYALFGPSRILVLGPDSSLAPIILAVTLSLTAGDPHRAVVVAGMMAVVSGVVCIAIGMLRLGFVTELLSKPIRYGYMNGIAFTVMIGQLAKLFGISFSSEGPVQDLVQIGRTVLQGQVNWTAFGLGSATLAVILLLKPYKRLPGLLLAVVAATVIVSLFRLDQSAGVAVLGPLPEGLPSFALPWIGFDDLKQILIGGCAVALVAFADTSVLSRAYAIKTHSVVDPNREMVGLGAANLAAGLFQGFPVSASFSRTPVAEAAGARTQLAGVIGAIGIVVLLIYVPNLLQSLPISALAAVVIAAAIGLFELADLRRIFRIQQWEFWLSMVCFAGVATFGVIPGIGFAVTLAIVEFLWDGWRPHFAVLGHVDGVRGYHDIERHPEARLVPGLVLFRWDAPLFFANAELFSQRLQEAVARSPTPVKRVVVAAEPVTSIDVTSADMLEELDDWMRQSGIELQFAEMKGPVKDKLKHFELFDRFGAFHPTVHAAVDAYLREHPLKED